MTNRFEMNFMRQGTQRRLTSIQRFGAMALVAACCLTLYPSAQALAADDAPSWLRQAASSGVPAYGSKVPAVVLFKEQVVKVDDDGRVTTVERAAVRVLSNEGRGEARASVHYLTGTGKVRDMRAWMVRSTGNVKKYGKDNVLDIAAAPNDIFDESRIKVISAVEDAEPGAIFGYEWTSEDRSVFTQFDWQFQDQLPTLLSRFTITLPENWRAEGVTFNHTRIEPVVSGSSYTWEKRNLPFIDEEPAGPPVTNIAPRLAVSYFPAPGAKSGIGRTFDSWSSVSRWLSELSDPQATLDDALAARAKQLTAQTATEYERIQAIGRYVQSVNYVSIQTGIGRGGGYRPHSATEVFAKSYGDCKDKANLMRAMLKAIGVQSYLVAIYAGDMTYVREEWPSPQQFNHMVIAVKVGKETSAPTIVDHQSLGRLLIFDPTDDSTPVGDLPGHEQGSLALVVAGDAGVLLRMPSTPPEANKLVRQAEVLLGPDGSITASVQERTTGQAAVDERRSFRRFSPGDYRKMIEEWISRGATGASISKVEPKDNSSEGRFSLDVEFKAPRYGQLMQGRLLVFKPAIVSRRESLLLSGATRQHSIVLQSNVYTETVRFKLPDGFKVDEMPDPAKLDAAFGSYATTYEVKDGYLHFMRSLLVRGMTLPVSDYEKVKSFFERIRSAEQAPVVLAKK